MINIGLLGFGTVGQGVYRILQDKGEELVALLGTEIEIKSILVRDLYKERKTEVPLSKLTLNPEDIVGDDDIDIVVEVTGDVDLSYRYISKAFDRGKHVVTANKAVVSAYFEELSHLAEENDVYFLYEASVAGGIPILKPLKDQIRANSISKVQGILNGTCNYILTRMTDEGLAYDDILKEAQNLGYAEADPSSDVEGIDTMRKLRILSTMALGASVTEDDIICDGIDSISGLDIGLLKEMGRKAKLIAEVRIVEGGYQAIVQPKAVPFGSYFSGVNGAENSVSIVGKYSGVLGFQGPGAGMYPTANAILTDVIDCILETQKKVNPLRGKRLENKNEDISGNYYLRISDYDETMEIPEKYIKEIIHDKGGEFAFITEKVKLHDLLYKLAEHEDKPFSLIALVE
ncbi:homoserine dehydrogenase [Gudongella sp. DL1XJH-153]|uniref:homoserine dehydrogenase n=1 Tax=Gudongella sp. DL1XJH-153 TaxID=3409804 RepID=UPI003BB4AA0C